MVKLDFIILYLPLLSYSMLYLTAENPPKHPFFFNGAHLARAKIHVVIKKLQSIFLEIT